MCCSDHIVFFFFFSVDFLASSQRKIFLDLSNKSTMKILVMSRSCFIKQIMKLELQTLQVILWCMLHSLCYAVIPILNQYPLWLHQVGLSPCKCRMFFIFNNFSVPREWTLSMKIKFIKKKKNQYNLLPYNLQWTEIQK